MINEVTAGSAIKAVQEASERICQEEYLKMKVAFLLSVIGATMGERRTDEN